MLSDLRLFATLCLVLLPGLLACANTAPAGSPAAAAARSDWRPPEAGLADWDWIRLTSDEWLKGEIIVLRSNSLQFESDKLGRLTIDWDDVREVHSKRTNSFLFGEDEIVVGAIQMSDGKVTVTEKDGTKREHPASELQTIVPGLPTEANYWSGKISLGAGYRKGNTDQVDYTLLGEIARRTLENRLTFKYTGGFSKVNDEVTLNSHRVNAAFDIFLTRRLYVTPIVVEYYRDPIANIDHQITPGAGLGYAIYDNPKTEWDVGGGFGYQHTKYVSVLAGEDRQLRTGSLRVETDLKHEVTDDIDLAFNYRFTLGIPETESRQHHLLTQLSFAITDDLDFDVSFLWDRVVPTRRDADGEKPEPDDFRITLGVGLEF
jgi:hypothetical protein